MFIAIMGRTLKKLNKIQEYSLVLLWKSGIFAEIDTFSGVRSHKSLKAPEIGVLYHFDLCCRTVCIG